MSQDPAPGRWASKKVIPAGLGALRIWLEEQQCIWISTLQEQPIALRASLSADALWLAALRLHRLFGKANFNPNQPRVPRGFREGGQWTREGGPRTPTTRPKLEFDKNGKPQPPATRPDDTKVRNSLSKQVSRWIRIAKRPSPLGLAAEILGEFPWLLEDGFSILSNLDPPRTLQDLQQTARLSLQIRGKAPPGYEIHHIVEQEAAQSDGFPEELIQSWENLVVVPKTGTWM